MNKTFVVATIFAFAGTAAVADALLDGGWRVSAGAVYNSPVKADLRLGSGSLGGFGGISYRPTGLTYGEARRRAKGMTDGTKTTYPSGATIDSADAHGDGKHTWNVYLPNGTFAGDSFRLASEDYAEVVETTSAGALRDYSDESAMPGISVDLSRNLWHDEEWDVGLDVSFGIMYFFRTDVYRADVNTGSTAYRSGTVETTIDAPDDVEDDWSWNDDGSYGAGTYEGPGPVFDLGSIRTVDHPNGTQAGGNAVSLRGDYRELELILSARPYYDVTDWFRLYGTVGMVVSRGEFDLDMVMSQRGVNYRSLSRDISEWNVYGIAGLGGMLRYKDFTLGCDFLARFLQDGLEIDDRYVHGTIDRGNWLFKIAVGYEF